MSLMSTTVEESPLSQQQFVRTLYWVFALVYPLTHAANIKNLIFLSPVAVPS
ncbi:hypothetical protein SISSUDRAFT_1056572 [Sistotremastrum suecicum HHB10207 ss-3]|uniref:Uncharacterized protein n=1 Tax=Sistotremastrum suecicum HHB10207 ss-3 TaxID=1314776 RepID=A0A165WKK6_9AGAM|nr:hypothetical protein SISSUDRAFT_1056572 [Sistotremastrum suecicum HHB10207 ss-3]